MVILPIKLSNKKTNRNLNLKIKGLNTKDHKKNLSSLHGKT